MSRSYSSASRATIRASIRLMVRKQWGTWYDQVPEESPTVRAGGVCTTLGELPMHLPRRDGAHI